MQVLFATAPGTTDYITTGKLRALAVTTASRAEVLPELQTVGDFVPGYEASQWYGIGAPRNTPAEIVDKLNREINAAIADPAMKARFAADRRRAAAGLACRVRQADRGGNREMGPGWSARPASSRSDASPHASIRKTAARRARRPAPFIRATYAAPASAASRCFSRGITSCFSSRSELCQASGLCL